MAFPFEKDLDACVLSTTSAEELADILAIQTKVDILISRGVDPLLANVLSIDIVAASHEPHTQGADL